MPGRQAGRHGGVSRFQSLSAKKIPSPPSSLTRAQRTGRWHCPTGPTKSGRWPARPSAGCSTGENVRAGFPARPANMQARASGLTDAWACRASVGCAHNRASRGKPLPHLSSVSSEGCEPPPFSWSPPDTRSSPRILFIAAACAGLGDCREKVPNPRRPCGPYRCVPGPQLQSLWLLDTPPSKVTASCTRTGACSAWVGRA